MLKEGLQRGLFLNKNLTCKTVVNTWQKSSLQLQCINKHVFLADITKKVPIYVHFVEKLQTFDLRALGGSFCRKFGWGAVYTFL